ncbi:hypothetical protein BJY16_006021 [Actinoplanes octamycinicus]|uniref:Metallo-beta-lactamase domain-containing protein n=1 Tax=Actinoplanes octamycinicus TaxID=135948 RepID=A0A7W7MA41_9ACTN|nr:MBL fold metallo-hydrolase [Actinoplanes octamycinicus]MBB4742562.1 hypothetical protein [Actinoplanes octamycinicus]
MLVSVGLAMVVSVELITAVRAAPRRAASPTTCPQSRILFTGDTIARAPDGTVLLGVFNTDPGQAADFLRRQAELDVDIACFGHGTPPTEKTSHPLKALASR